MSSNFFIRKSKSNLKRASKTNHSKQFKRARKDVETKSIDSDEILSDDDSIIHHSEEDSNDNFVTAQEKKITLAKKYIEEIEKEEKERLESGDVQSSIVTRLRDDVLSQAGKLNKKLADKITKPIDEDIKVMRCKDHKLSLTCVVVSPDGNFIYSASKDAVIVKWSVESKSKVGVILSKHKQKDEKCKEHSHNSSILSLAVSFDGKYLASGDEGSIIRIWNTDSLVHLHSFKGHKSSITGLAFCSESNNLYSCSKDRSVRIWNLDEMSYVEALFGHQCGITDIDVLKKDRAVSSGGTDNTLRVWKVQEESQLIFNGHQKSIDRVRRLDQQHFLSCGDDGQICLWGVLKKKPLCIIHGAHGVDLSNNQPNWINSISCLPNSDLIASGSSDGYLRFWKCEENFRNISPLFTVPVTGFINAISFSKDETFLVIGVGQEHRLGRWFTEKRAKNSLIFIPLKQIS
ncbi:pre-rRNA processing protein [Homalodisca vitripennis]|nr:pre-rRNA processing protein [Homalodisca vitripennis]